MPSARREQSERVLANLLIRARTTTQRVGGDANQQLTWIQEGQWLQLRVVRLAEPR